MVTIFVVIQAVLVVVCWRLVVRDEARAQANRRALEEALAASRAEREVIDELLREMRER